MPQAIKIGKSVFQVDDGALGSAIDQQLEKLDSITLERDDYKTRLDAAEAAKDSLATELSEAKASLSKADSAKVEADATIAALQTKLDAATAKNKEWEDKVNKKKPDEDIEEEMDEEGKPKGKRKPKMDSDEVKSYCKEFLAVVSEVTPALKKVDSAFEPDFGLSPLEYKAQYLKTLSTLPAEARTRIDSEGADRDMFVEHLYMALKPQVQTSESKADEGTEVLANAIERNRELTVDSGERKGVAPKEDSPTMKARKERQLPSAYRK